MIKIESLELFSVDLPFKNTFKHAAAIRKYSNSIFLKCTTDTGHIGYGETLPREYVTGESRDDTFNILHKKILPKLKEMTFSSFQEVITFLKKCDGYAPSNWVNKEHRHTAAWCAIDLCLLDAFSKAFNTPIKFSNSVNIPPTFRYSPVISADSNLKLLNTLVKIRLFNCKQVKLKINKTGNDFTCWLTRKILGKQCDIRVDANMAWNTEHALNEIRKLSKYKINSFEQPLPANDLTGLASITQKTNADIMVDESLSDKKSLEELIEKNACTALNVRISKCGGLIAAYNRCNEGLQAGLKIQLGCLTGESSLLSAAHLKLVTAVQDVTYGESCFGLLLLKEDPVTPVLQFGYGGKPPIIQNNIGFGVKINTEILNRWSTRSELIN